MKITQTAANNRNILATAVAGVMFGATGMVAVQAASVTVSGTTTSFATDNSTSEFWIGNNSTLNFTGAVNTFYGTIDGTALHTAANGTLGSRHGNVTITNVNPLTLYGNIGASNATGNFTLEKGSVVYLADNMTTFKSENLILGTDTTFYTGNNASQGYNRKGADSSNALTITSNITLGTGSVLNVGNGTTILGNIDGYASGKGTLNINGNFSTGTIQMLPVLVVKKVD